MKAQFRSHAKDYGSVQVKLVQATARNFRICASSREYEIFGGAWDGLRFWEVPTNGQNLCVGNSAFWIQLQTAP